MVLDIIKSLITLIFTIMSISIAKADMNDPLQSRINPGIIAKLFPSAESLGAPTGTPPYIPVYGTDDNVTIDETVLAKWRIEFLQVEAREPTEEETKAKIASLKKTGFKKEIGVLFSTYETTKAKGYSGDHFDIIVGLKTDGRLAGSVIVELHEPMICPTCVPQTKLTALHDTFKGANINRRVNLNSGTGGGRGYDGVTGATISATLTTNGIITAAKKVLRQTGLGANEGPFYLDVDSFLEYNWSELVNWGGVVGKSFTNEEIRKELSPKNEDYIRNPDRNFTTIYTGLASPASVGKNIFGGKWYSYHVSQLATGDNLLVVLGSGLYSWKKNDYKRVSLVQKDKKWKFSKNEALKATALRIKEKPNLSQVGLLRVPKEWGFDPLEKWSLEFEVNEKFVNGNFSINYELPNQLITGDPVALEDAGLRPIKTAFLGLVRESKLNGWQSEWAKQDFSILILSALLIILSCLLIFQKKISANKKIHNYIRFAFLTITLTWLGWIAQAQLSIVNIISYAQALVQGKGYTQFLFEPLMCIIFVYTVFTLILLGRGVFCGWLCPFGAMQELAYKFGRLIKLPEIHIPFWLNERLWVLKYLILMLIAVTIIIGNDWSYSLIEIEPFKTAITSYFDRSLPYIIYAGILIAIALFTERFFCRFMCPLGAVLAFLGRFHIFDMIPRRPECGNPCHLCEKSCPVQAIAPSGKINMNECFQCLDCEVEYYDDSRCPPLIFEKKQSKKSI